MAIKPSQANKLDSRDTETITRLEREIDAFLAKEQGKNHGTFPSFDFTHGNVPSEKVIEELIRRYKVAGWESVKHLTGRDANCLQFMDKIPDILRNRK